MAGSTIGLEERTFDAHRDSTDFRDLIYRPTLQPLPPRVLPDRALVRVRDQGEAGACTGFGLAAVIDYLNRLRRRAGVIDNAPRVSARMLYEIARMHDRWPGEEHEGSSARGAMKGWHKHGVCGESEWRFEPESSGSLTARRQRAALRNPLGAYYRVLPRRPDIHAALVEGRAVFATARIHVGWERPVDGVIQLPSDDGHRPAHAFAILGYTETGLIVQNSWGEAWGGAELGGESFPGLALWTYPDFDRHLLDAWVAQMARPVESIAALRGEQDIAQTASGPERVEAGPPAASIYHHYLHIDDGHFDPEGNYPSGNQQALEVVKRATSGPRHLVLWAHGGLNSVKAAAQRAAKLGPVFAANGIHDVHLIWETGLRGELRDVLLGKQQLAEDRAGGPASSWWDRLLEKSTWPLGRPLWREMTTDAEIAFAAELRGGRPAGSNLLDHLKRALATASQPPRLHLVGHSAGAILLAHALQRWRDLSGPPVDSLTLLAPAAPHSLFFSHILPRLTAGDLARLRLFLLSDEKERRDTVASIYRKSLLYLVSNSYQKSRAELNGPGLPLLGMQAHLAPVRQALSGFGGRATIRVSGEDEETRSETHGGFDNDVATMNSVLRGILGALPQRAFEPGDLDF